MSDRFKNQRRSPRQARSRATYDAILEAASQILERDGPRAFNTNAVAERAGVSVGTLYQYFPDKEAVLLAAAAREFAVTPLPGRQTALLQALIFVVGSIRRLGGRAGAWTEKAPITGAQAANIPRPVRRAPSQASRLANSVHQAIIQVATLFEPLLVQVPVYARVVTRRRQ